MRWQHRVRVRPSPNPSARTGLERQALQQRGLHGRARAVRPPAQLRRLVGAAGRARRAARDRHGPRRVQQRQEDALCQPRGQRLRGGGSPDRTASVFGTGL